MKEVKRINILSVAKIMGLSMAIVGFIVGLIVGFIMFVIGTIFGSTNGFSTLLAPGLGILGFVAIPLLYGIFGFLLGALVAFIYNRLASWIGGIEIEIEEKD